MTEARKKSDNDPFREGVRAVTGILGALRDALTRWPQGVYAFWYPIKLRRSLAQFYRRAATLPAKSSFVAELLVRADDSPLRMNGSGLLILNPPWQFDQTMAGMLPLLTKALGEDAAASCRVEWLKREE